MPAPTKGPRLGGGPAHERLLLANLATALFEHGSITTTEAKAKRLRPLAERLITFAKRGDLHARRQVLTVVRDNEVVHELFAEIGPSPTDAQLMADLALPIEELDLTVRSYNCLKREGIHSVGELVSRSEADLMDIRNFGAKSIDEVKGKLHSMGLALKDSPPGFDPSAVIGAYDDNYSEDNADGGDAGFAETEQY